MVNAIIKKHFIQIIQLNVLIEMPGIRCYQWAYMFYIFGIWLHLVYGIRPPPILKKIVNFDCVTRNKLILVN